MFIEKTVTGYDRDGCQVARRALFLILVQEAGGAGKGEIRAVVRKVALRQFGHFMMGHAMVQGKRLTISGSYGSDGLPVTVPPEVFNIAIPLPFELLAAWNVGGGHNGSGSEAEAMRQWAMANLDRLYHAAAREKASRERQARLKLAPPTSRLSFKRARAAVQNFCSRLCGVHFRARREGPTAEALREEIKRVTYGTPEWKRLPQWAQAEVTGYGRALSDEDYSSHLEWRMYFRGKYVSGDDVPEGGWSEVESGAGCHFWRQSGKPFGTAKAEVLSP